LLIDTASFLLILRIHDLRRTLGSWQAAAGVPLHTIGKSLGHRNLSTTQIYSRLDLDPVRQAVELATSAMLDAARVAGPA
jgi:integrase